MRSQLQKTHTHTHTHTQEVALFLLKNPPFWMLLLAGSIRNIPGYALGAWLPTFFARQYNVDPDDYSIPVGFVVLFGGGLGSFLGGFLSDRCVWVCVCVCVCVCVYLHVCVCTYVLLRMCIHILHVCM